MIRNLLGAFLLLSPLFAGTAARAQEILSGSLIEALKAIEKPELGGVFTYVGDKNAPTAFADLIEAGLHPPHRERARGGELLRSDSALRRHLVERETRKLLRQAHSA